MQRATVASVAGMWGADLYRQIVRSRAILTFTMVVCLLVMACAAFMSWWLDQPIWYFTQDPATTTLSSWSIGIVSQVGVVLWSAATAVCALAGALLWPLRARRQAALFAFASGALTALYLLDDALLIHEGILRDHLGIPEIASYAAYGALGLAYLVHFVQDLRRTDYVILLVSLALGGVSMAVDVINPYLFLLEDGAKFLAIALWFAYYFQAMTTLVRENLASPPARE